MRRSLLASTLSVLLVTPCFAQWRQGGEEISDVSWRKEEHGFGAMLILTRQPEQFLEQWNTPPRPGFAPNISSAGNAVRGEKIVAFVVFNGCKPNAESVCDARVEFAILRPDGSPYGEKIAGTLWRMDAPPEGSLQLGETYLGIEIEPEDTLGTYPVSARACDHVGEVCLELEISFAALEPAEAVDFKTFFQGYYTDPRPLLLEAALQQLDRSAILGKVDSRAPVVGFLAALLGRSSELLEATEAFDPELGESTLTVLRTARNLAKQPVESLTELPASPSQNDMLWGAFFATGDPIYIETLVRRLDHLTERKNRDLFLAGASAQWSLSSNARQHPKVGEILIELKATTTPVRAEAIDAALSRDPAGFREEIGEVLRSQREAGIW